MTRRRPAALLPAVVFPVVLLVAGCSAGQPSDAPSTTAAAEPTPSPSTPSPTPSPEPSGPPPVADLVLSPDGLGPLLIGEPIDPALATFDPQGCRTEENQDVLPPDDPGWAAYVPNFPKEPVDVLGATYELYPFEPHHTDDGSLWWLRVRSDSIRTEEGIGLGSSQDEILAAHPDAEVHSFLGSDVYVVSDEDSRLVFEVASDESLGAPIGNVWDVRVEPLEWEPTSLAFGDAGGFCTIGV